jgi:hypothetical protein
MKIPFFIPPFLGWHAVRLGFPCHPNSLPAVSTGGSETCPHGVALSPPLAQKFYFFSPAKSCSIVASGRAGAAAEIGGDLENWHVIF